MPRLSISSDDLPAELDDITRARRWMEMSERFYGSIDRRHAHDRTFFAELSLLRADTILTTRHRSTLTRAARTDRNVSEDGNDGFLVGFYGNGSALAHGQMGRDISAAESALSVLSFAEPGELLIVPGREWFHLNIPGEPLRELLVDPDDLAARPFDGDLPSMRFLRSYVEFLHGPDAETANNAGLERHIATNLIDLVALCLGARRDAAELAATRGLRAARLELVIAGISSGFADPAFSVQRLARDVGLSIRYVQDLLHENGSSFTQRVTELRLQKARAILTRSRFDRLNVSDIAFSCGFNEVSHFNRCFRWRFGMTPTGVRKTPRH